VQVCHSCGEWNSNQARFCQACSTQLAVPAAGGEVRKTVTVLFSDITGSTSLGEHLDPETLRRVMSRYFDRMRSVLQHHGGTVEKFIGDAVMAVFGVPVIHEDDALRAVRSAAEMREELDRLNKELERDWGITLVTRTGVNTGEVVAGGPSTGQTLVTGDAVNTAARLEQAAAPGEILIGRPTYELVRNAVVVEPVQPIAAKGKAEVVPTHRLLSVIPGAPARARGLDSPMVGREAEFHLLEEAFDRAAAGARCVLATVIGVPGVGKSRLALEFLASISDRATILRGRCLPYGEGITFWPLSDVVRQAAGITEGDLVEDARSRIEALLPKTEERTAIRDRVAAAVGLGEGAGELRETFWAIRKVLEALAADRSLVVVFDDIQWAEPTFLDLIEYLEGWIRDAPVLIVCLARPDLLEARREWATTATATATATVIVALAPLTGEESDRLIDNLLGQSELPAHLRRRIAETAGGNPLFVEEMLGMLIDQGQLRREGARWVAAGDLSSVPTPPSIQALLAARIERLPEGERAILQRASVVGKVFWWGAVAKLSPAADRERVGSLLQALVRRELIRPDESPFSGEDAFRFRHILIRDAAYASLPRAARADLHERFAGWLERTIGERAEEYEEILGYHLEQSLVTRLTPRTEGDRELAARASRLLSSAGRRALNRDDAKAALNLLSRASQLIPEEPENLAIMQWLSQATRLTGDYRRAEEVLRDLEERARAAGDLGMEWRAKIGQAWLLAITTKATFEEIVGPADRAIEIFSRLGDEWGLSRTWSLLAWAHFNAGRAGEAQEANARAAAHARSAGDASEEMKIFVGLASNAAFGPMPVEEALGLCRELLEQVKGQPGHEAGVDLSRGLLEAMRGNFNAARTAMIHARSLWVDLGNTHRLAGMTFDAADVEWYAGDTHAEERERRSGYEAFGKMGAWGLRATSAAGLARALVELGRNDEALELTRESEELAGEDDITAQVPWRGARAKVLARRGATEEAVRIAREGVAIAERTDWLNLRGDARMDLAEVLRLMGREDESRQNIQLAIELFEQKGNSVMASRARTFLEQLSVRET
jgi:class 3 adenylate cyclase/tetratricopeptide (TPR) repeat protein